MKKLLLALSLLGITGLAFGQGQLVSNNSATTAITNRSTNVRAVSTTIVGFYANANASATASSPGWVLAGGTTNLFAPGLFIGGTRTYAGFPAGTAAAFQVRAWLTTGTYGNYEDAWTAEGPNGVGWFGASVVMTVTPQVSPSPIPTMASSGLQPFTIQQVPEPSTIALGVLGLGAVALLRRRK
jgi:hypothetical protein